MRNTFSTSYTRIRSPFCCPAQHAYPRCASFITKNRANIVVQPLEEFNKLTLNVTEGNLDEELGNIEYGSSELQLIGNRFSMLIQGMRFSNQHFFVKSLARTIFHRWHDIHVI